MNDSLKGHAKGKRTLAGILWLGWSIITVGFLMFDLFRNFVLFQSPDSSPFLLIGIVLSFLLHLTVAGLVAFMSMRALAGREGVWGVIMLGVGDIIIAALSSVLLVIELFLLDGIMSSIAAFQWIALGIKGIFTVLLLFVGIKTMALRVEASPSARRLTIAFALLSTGLVIRSLFGYFFESSGRLFGEDFSRSIYLTSFIQSAIFTVYFVMHYIVFRAEEPV